MKPYDIGLFLTFQKIFVIIYIEIKVKEKVMTLQVLEALAIIVKFCQSQDNCDACILRAFCGKMPCEW